MKLIVGLAALMLFHSCSAQANANCTVKIAGCPKVMKVNWWNVAPYITKNPPGQTGEKGIFKEIVKDIMEQCCGDCIEFEYNPNPANNSEILKSQIGANESVLSFPIYGTMTSVKFQNQPYFPVIESPGVIYIVKPQDAANAGSAVLDAVFRGWPVLVLTLIMAALSGIIMWALDSYWNPDQFPSSFFPGVWEGFWWAFVSMTTVGYGDRAPKSFIARIFAFFWVLVGLVIISIFTATVTTSLTALSLSNEITLYGSNIVALNNTEEQRYGVKNNAKVYVVGTVDEFKSAILGTNPNIEEGVTIDGGLIDSYVAGEEKDKLSEADGLRVGTVFDHQFAYGFVISEALVSNKNIERCLRRTLSTKESMITQMIQNQMEALPEPAKSAAEEKSSNLFDPESDIFKRAVFVCLGLIAILTICGVAWEYGYWRPKQKRENPEKKGIDERTLTPHTSFEELVAAQCQELEDAMITEVMAFYKAFNKKLEDIRKRHLRDDNLGKQDPDVLLMEDEPTKVKL